MWFIPIIIIVVSLAVIVYVIIRKLPQIRIIDVNTIPKERERKVKEQLILQKFNRKGGAKLRSVSKKTSKAVVAVSKVGRRAVQKLYKMEQYYQKMKRSTSEGQHAYGSEVIKGLIDKAEKLIKEDEFIPAEKIFIDIISHNPKSVDAYEALGNMYIEAEQFEQARETLTFALRLSPDDASLNVSLAELEIELENHKGALEYLRKAVEKRSKNPKYLDFYIEAGLKAGALKDVRKGITALREVNPENTKIEGFEKKFQEMKEKYIQKTESKEDELNEEVSTEE
jgi:predicted Zn-dependent protease